MPSRRAAARGGGARGPPPPPGGGGGAGRAGRGGLGGGRLTVGRSGYFVQYFTVLRWSWGNRPGRYQLGTSPVFSPSASGPLSPALASGPYGATRSSSC